MARPRDKTFKHGRYGYDRYKCKCDVCRAATASHQRDFQSKNRGKVRMKDRKRYSDDPSKNRECCWRRDGVDMDWAKFQATLQLQKHACAICGTPIVEKASDGLNVACVDHRHSDGKVRGLLCKKCNLMLGYARDSGDILAQGILYLKKTE